MKCEICKRDLIKNQKRFCCIKCRSIGSSIFNKDNNIIPPSRKGYRFTQEEKEKLKKTRGKYESSMKRPEVVVKVMASKKRNFDLKGRKSRLRELIKRMQEYKDWRTAIFERDNYTCIFCLKRGWEIQADHIKPYSVIVRENNIKDYLDARNCKELWDIENGRTLCRECHKKTETFGNNKITNPYPILKNVMYNKNTNGNL